MKLIIKVLYDSSTDTNDVEITNQLTGKIITLKKVNLNEARGMVIDYIIHCL